MDKFEYMVQAYEYEERIFGEEDLEEFQGLSLKIQSPKGRACLGLLQQERQVHFLKQKRRIPVVFFIGTFFSSHWPQVLIIVQVPTELARRHNTLSLYQKFGFQHISWDDVLRENSDDLTYLYAKFVKDCLKEKVEGPRQLRASLLEKEISEGIGEGKKWSLVHGFP